MLDDRKSRILQSLVEEHIRTGEPVSSQGVLDHGDFSVSSATIRNELASLEAYGFVVQPHTSSGRVPTRQGYRYYVDHCQPALLRVATHARIEAFFADVHREVSRLPPLGVNITGMLFIWAAAGPAMNVKPMVRAAPNVIKRFIDPS